MGGEKYLGLGEFLIKYLLVDVKALHEIRCCTVSVSWQYGHFVSYVRRRLFIPSRVGRMLCEVFSIAGFYGGLPLWIIPLAVSSFL